jgi:putative DNA primase/helicase
MLLLMTNAKPRAPIDDYAFWKRIKTINFPLSFVEEPTEQNERLKDPDIAEKLKKEAKGILAWLVQGCLDYQEYGLVEPETVTAANMQYMKDVDLTGVFIEDCCVIGSGTHVLFKHLYAAYKQWAQEYGLRPLSGKALGQYLGKRFDKEPTREGPEYRGIGLLNFDQAS